MNKLLFLPFIILLTVTACAPANTPEAVGQYNLSKGSCHDIVIAENHYSEEMTKTHCDMVGGKFKPRNRKRFIWF